VHFPEEAVNLVFIVVHLSVNEILVERAAQKSTLKSYIADAQSLAATLRSPNGDQGCQIFSVHN
jgi:hypothetical protein